MQNKHIIAIKESIKKFLDTQEERIQNSAHLVGLINPQGKSAALSSEQQETLFKKIKQAKKKVKFNEEELKNFLKDIVIFSSIPEIEKYRTSIYSKLFTLSHKLHPQTKENQLSEYYRYNCGTVQKSYLILHSNLTDIFEKFPSKPPILSEEQFNKMSNDLATTVLSMFNFAPTKTPGQSMAAEPETRTAKSTERKKGRNTPKAPEQSTEIEPEEIREAYKNIKGKIVVYEIPSDWLQTSDFNTNNQTNLDIAKQFLYIKTKSHNSKEENILENLRELIFELGLRRSMNPEELWNQCARAPEFLIIHKDLFSKLDLANSLSSKIKHFIHNVDNLDIVSNREITNLLDALKNKDHKLVEEVSLDNSKSPEDRRRKRVETDEEFPSPPSKKTSQALSEAMVIEDHTPTSPQFASAPLSQESEADVSASTQSATITLSREMASMVSMFSDTFQTSIQSLESQIKKLERKNTNLQQELEARTNDALQKEQQLEQLQKDAQEKGNERIKNLEDVNQKLNTTINTLTTKVQEQQNNIHAYLKEKDTLQQTISGLKTELTDANKAIEKLKNTHALQEERIKTLIEAGNQLRGALTTQTEENKALLTKIQSDISSQRDATSRQMNNIQLLTALFLKPQTNFGPGSFVYSSIPPTSRPTTPPGEQSSDQIGTRNIISNAIPVTVTPLTPSNLMAATFPLTTAPTPPASSQWVRTSESPISQLLGPQLTQTLSQMPRSQGPATPPRQRSGQEENPPTPTSGTPQAQK